MSSPLNRVVQHVLADFGPDGPAMTDGELLTRFLRARDDDALAALVRRHASMVWGVCCRLLPNRHDAEDAFQATFLVLVRKSADVPRLAVANWLYGVARQTAVRLRTTSAKRRRRETQVVNMPEPANRGQDSGVRDQERSDLQSVLDEELSRLPDHYRGVIVLCDLEDLTRKEAARQLGIPEGSVASRLARARAMLARRLTRRGVALFAGSIAAAGSASSAPPALVASTIHAASLLAAGQAAGAVSASVASLAEGVVKAMFASKFKNVVTVILIAGMTFGGISIGVGLSTNSAAVGQQPGAKANDGKKRDDTIDWRIRVLDEQIANLKQVKKQTDEDAAQLNKRSEDIERTIGDLRAQRERFLKKAAEERPAQPKHQHDKTDQERMIGNWFIVNTDSGRKGEMWVITADGILMHAKDLTPITRHYAHRLDAGKNPKQIDITATKVNGASIGVIKGIYALNGDELQLCLTAMNEDRPRAFPKKPKPGEVLILQRSPHGASPPKSNEPPAATKNQSNRMQQRPMTREEKLQALIAQVLAAHGGEEKLKKLQFTMTAKHSNGETQKYFVEPPKHFRWETTHRDSKTKRIVILFPEGRRWWNQEPNQEAREFVPTGAEPLTVEGWYDYVKFFGPRQVLRLKDADHKAALLDEEAKIGDRPAVGVQVTGPHFNHKMYFDKETHLLLKSFGVNLREVTYSDYKKFDGILIAQTEHDGYFEPKITNFKIVDKFDAKLFEKP